jgi:hypothetical protein
MTNCVKQGEWLHSIMEKGREARMNGMNDFERGWKAAIDEAEQAFVKCQLIPLMTPPDHPLFQLFFALKDSVVKLRNVLPTEADL